MAEQIESYDWKSRRARKRLYPWDEWLNGQTWRISKDDIRVAFTSFRSMAYSAAHIRGLRVRTVMDESSIVIQAYEYAKGE